MTPRGSSKALAHESPLLGSLRHTARRAIMVRPSLYLPLARWKRGDSMVGPSTQLVLDGFERSANTFAVIAFQLAQNDHVRVAHHMHAAAPLIVVAQRGLPTLVAVREPEPTVVSAAIRDPRATLRQWLKTYVSFYEAIAPVRSGFVVGRFEDVTSDLGRVIYDVNERFGTNFIAFRHTEANVRTVYELIDERAEGPPWQPTLNRFVSGFVSADEYWAATRSEREARAAQPRAVREHRVSRPSETRREARTALRERYRDPTLRRLRAMAERAYGVLTS
jgi:hypothetical protein